MANPNVFQQLIQPVRSIGEYASDLDKQEANRLALDGQRRQNALQDAAFQQQVRRQNAIERAMAKLPPNATNEQRASTFREDPLTFDLADALDKSELERSKTRAAVAKDEAEAEKIRLASDYMKRDRHLQGLANVTDPQQAAAWIGQGVQLGEFSMQQAQQVIQGLQSGQIPLDQWKQRAQQGGMTLQQQAQQRMQEITAAETQRHNQSTEKLTARGQDMTASTAIRGQNMTDARSREANQLTRDANQNVYDSERGVLVNKTTGLARPAATMDGKPVGAKDKGLNDTQAKALLFGTRMQEAEKAFQQLSKQGVDQRGGTKRFVEGVADLVPFMGDKLADTAGTLTNWTQSAEQQQVEQAQRDFLNAVLRRESGAAIGASEFANGVKQYFPQPGDSDEVIAQKAKNRQLATRLMLEEVPEARRNAGAPAPAPIKPGSVLKFDANGNRVQ